jgi:NADPH:quinone reductase-like Zn-dependent oxidoreductase
LAFGLFKPKKQILGGYFAGVIESIGSDVTTLKRGERIFGSTQFRFGAYGEYVCLPASHTLVPVPKNISLEQAAAVPLGGLNALHFMNKARIKRGERVLINGAGGSIGSFAVQIAKSMGAEVTAVDAGFKEAILRKIGADHFIDYTQQNFTRNGQAYDVIFNMVAQSSFSACIRSLTPNGRYLIGNPRVSDMVRSVLNNRRSVKKTIFAFAGEKPEELNVLSRSTPAGRDRAARRLCSYFHA